MDQQMSGNSERWGDCRRTILLVEDEAFVRDVAAEVLLAAGYWVLAAANAMEAVRIYDLEHGRIDLLFSDVRLPGETGLALAKRLRRKHPGLRVLLATGYGELMGAHPDGDECLAKPFSSAQLLGRVQEILGEATGIGSGVASPHFAEGSSGGLGQSLCV